MLFLLIGLVIGFVFGNLNKNSRKLFENKQLPSMQDIIVGWRK